MGGSGGMVGALVAAAVVVVGLVAGGVFLLTRDKGDPVATSSSSSTKSTPTTKPKPTTTRADSDGLDAEAALALAQAAFPAGPGHSYVDCLDGGYASYDAEVTLTCFVDDFQISEVYVWSDTATALQSIRDDYKGFAESSWDGGTEFRYESSSGAYYEVFRCYADAPVCIEVLADDQAGADTVLGRFAYLDAAGIDALNNTLAGRV